MSDFFKTTCLKFSAAAFFLLFLQSSYSQVNSGELSSVIETRKKILGNDLVVLIANKDSIIFRKEYGEFNGKTQAPIASCSKWLTAAAVMQFVDEGKISLDDNITKWLPEYAKYWKNYITLRHCLSHMTGIQSEPFKFASLIQRKKFASLEEEVNQFASREIVANPGNEFRYSEIGLNIAARVLEVVSKKKFDVLIRQRLFMPLEMRGTTFGTIDGSAINPSGGARSTANDYLHFLQMLLNNGTYKGKRILSEESVKELKKITAQPSQIKYAPAAAQGFTYAMGSWVLEQDKDGKEATALSSPGLFGTWPMVDFCHDYVAIFFVKDLLGEQKADSYMTIKKVIDSYFKNDCK